MRSLAVCSGVLIVVASLIDRSPLRAQEAGAGGQDLTRLAIFGSGAPEGSVALFGHGFPKGALQKSDAVIMRLADGRSTLRTQINPVTSWPDGSVKVALLAVECPTLAKGATQECVLVKAPAPDVHVSPLDLAAMLKVRSAAITLIPTNGAPWTFDLLAAATGPDLWHNGPLAVSTRVETKVPGNVVGVTSLRLVADVIVTKDGILEIDSRLANDAVLKVGGGPATYAYTVTIDGTDVYTQKPAEHLQYTAWVRRNGRGRGGPMPERPLISPDFDVLVKGGFTLPWDRALSPTFIDPYIVRTITAWQPQANTPYPAWGINRGAGEVGGRQEIGYRTYASMVWIKTGLPAAQFLAQRQLEVGMSRPQNLWDDERGTWMTVEEWPNFNASPLTRTSSPAGTPRDKAIGLPRDQPPKANTREHVTIDHAHNADYWSVVALLSGRRMAYDGLAMNAAWQTIDTGRMVPDPTARNATWRGLKPDFRTGIAWAPQPGGPQIRGFAWGIRDVSLAAALLPDAYPRREYYSHNIQAWINSYGSQLDKLRTERGELAGWVPHTNGRERASGFMSSFVIYAILDAMNMDVAGPNGAAVLEYLANFRIGAFNSPDFNWRNAASGKGIFVGNGTNLFTRWAQSQAAHMAAKDDINAEWSNTWPGEGDWQRNGLAGIALLRDAPLPLAMRAKAADAMVLFRSERPHGKENHPRISPDAFFGPFENLNSLCPYGSTWRWDVPPVVRAGQEFNMTEDAKPGTLVGLVVTDGGLPRASKPEGTDAFVIVEQPAGNPFAISRGGGLKLVGKPPAGETTIQVYAATFDNEGKEHRGPTVPVKVKR